MKNSTKKNAAQDQDDDQSAASEIPRKANSTAGEVDVKEPSAKEHSSQEIVEAKTKKESAEVSIAINDLELSEQENAP